MIDATFVQKIRELADAAGTKIIDVDDRTFSTAPLHEIREFKEIAPAPLVVSTLTGLRDYVLANKDVLELRECSLHVVSPGVVNLISQLKGEAKQRFTYCSAKLIDRFEGNRAFAFGSFIKREGMTVALLTLFEQDIFDTPAVQRIVGNVSNEAIRTESDTGVHQIVVAKSALSVVENVIVPNPVKLAPFRTFPEIEQPCSAFTLRMQQKNGDTEVALFEADGGAWQQDAIIAIAEWLRKEVPGVAVIA